MSNNLKLYIQSAEVVRDFLTARGSLKNLCYAPSIENKKATLALVHQTLKFKPVLVELLSMAQVPGFRYCDLKRYDLILKDIANGVDFRGSVADADLDSDDEYELSVIERKKARTASFHKNKNNATNTESTDAGDEDSMMDVEAEDDNLGITDSWHSCMVNTYLPFVSKSAVPTNSKNKDEDEYDAMFASSSRGSGSNKHNRKRKFEDKKEDKGSKVRYSREAMLVIAYDFLFGKGMPRLDREEQKDELGLCAAARTLTHKASPLYLAEAQMIALGERMATEHHNTYHRKQDGETKATIASVGASAKSNAKPQWLQKTAPSSSLQLDSLFKPQQGGLWGSSKADKTSTTVSTNTVTGKTEVSTDVTHMHNQTNKTTGVTNTSVSQNNTNTAFYSMAYMPPREWTLKHRLKAALQFVKASRHITATTRAEQDELLLPASLRHLYGRKFPRYARINTLLISVDEAMRQIKKMGYTVLDSVPEEYRHRPTEHSDADTLTQTDAHDDGEHNSVMRGDDDVNGGVVDHNYERLYTHGAGTRPKHTTAKKHKQTPTPTSSSSAVDDALVCWMDPFVANLVCFLPNDLKVLGCDMVTEDHTLIIQDKASCFPPLALLPRPGSAVIDGCSAPGNKTSFLSALMRGEGPLYAIELNARRAGMMAKRLKNAGAKNVQVLNTSFFSLDPQDARFKDVEYILLDPSCSGSGNPSLDVLLATEGDMHTFDSPHVRSLSDLQSSLVKHAFTFPSVHTVVYSTCSIFNRENEGVVHRLTEAAEANGFELVPCLSRWPCRGFNTINQGDLDGVDQHSATPLNKIPVNQGHYTARIFADEYHTGGFYVACFKKKNTFKLDTDLKVLGETLRRYGYDENGDRLFNTSELVTDMRSDEQITTVVESSKENLSSIESKTDSIEPKVTIIGDTVIPMYAPVTGGRVTACPEPEQKKASVMSGMNAQVVKKKTVMKIVAKKTFITKK